MGDFVPYLVQVSDTFQKAYSYWRTVPEGNLSDERFLPEMTPIDMLEAGVFGGKYMTDCQAEFPAHRRTNAKLAPHHDPSYNFFGVDASLSLAEWQKK